MDQSQIIQNFLNGRDGKIDTLVDDIRDLISRQVAIFSLELFPNDTDGNMIGIMEKELLRKAVIKLSNK